MEDKADTASQTGWPGSRVPDQLREKMGDKLEDRTEEADTASQTRCNKMGDKRKTSPARRTQHSKQGGHIKKALRTPTVNCLGKNRATCCNPCY